jgi:hypothetical protein
MSTQRDHMLREWTTARDEAEALLRSLLEAKRESEKRLSQIRQTDAMKRVTGRSALDNAIASTKRMVETLEWNIGQARRHLTDEDLELIGEGARG